MQKRMSIKAIAKELDISPTTISFVLNGKALDKRISPALISKIQEHIEKIGYQPNQMARSLRTGKSKIIVFMVEDISDPISGATAKILEQRLFQEGYTTLYCSTDNGREKTSRLIRQFNDLSVAGYIIAPPPTFTAEELLQLVGSEKPLVLFDYPFGQSEVKEAGLSGIASVQPQGIPQAYSANELSQLMISMLGNNKNFAFPPRQPS
ncbi:MAG TPA: LacI family DNA-binding transcriptional regulator [Cyclobacteriaceae bacterium]|nr:LacI family DNA-binding transcriptional regulator [Cyclobacteriaceae bacterium]